jgi:hypothetical protein
MRRPPMRPFRLLLDPVTRSRLRSRAKAHGVTQSAFLRALINNHRPGATPGSDVAAADAWWDSRSPARRVSIHRNHAARASVDDGNADQLTIFDGSTHS